MKHPTRLLAIGLIAALPLNLIPGCHPRCAPPRPLDCSIVLESPTSVGALAGGSIGYWQPRDMVGLTASEWRAQCETIGPAYNHNTGTLFPMTGPVVFFRLHWPCGVVYIGVLQLLRCTYFAFSTAIQDPGYFNVIDPEPAWEFL